MKEGPSSSVIRSRSQATASCCGQKAVVALRALGARIIIELAFRAVRPIASIGPGKRDIDFPAPAKDPTLESNGG